MWDARMVTLMASTATSGNKTVAPDTYQKACTIPYMVKVLQESNGMWKATRIVDKPLRSVVVAASPRSSNAVTMQFDAWAKTNVVQCDMVSKQAFTISIKVCMWVARMVFLMAGMATSGIRMVAPDAYQKAREPPYFV